MLKKSILTKIHDHSKTFDNFACDIDSQFSVASRTPLLYDIDYPLFIPHINFIDNAN